MDNSVSSYFNVHFYRCRRRSIRRRRYCDEFVMMYVRVCVCVGMLSR